jgi:hypothetical protein
MAGGKSKKKSTTVTLSGSKTGKGKITGKGALTLSVPDATKVSVTVDARPGSTKVSLKSTVGIKVRKSSTITFSGSFVKDLARSGLKGKVGIDMVLPKGVNVTVSHQFKPGDDLTSVKLTIRF